MYAPADGKPNGNPTPKPSRAVKGTGPDLLRLLSDPAFSPLYDVQLAAEGKEIRAHRCILASCSSYFQEQFCNIPNPPTRIEFPQTRYAVLRQLVRFLYGGEIDEHCSPEEVMDLLAEARALGVPNLTGDELAHLVVPRLTFQNCLAVLQHEELLNQPSIAQGVVGFVGEHFFDLLQLPGLRAQLQNLHRRYLIDLLRVVCMRCVTDDQAAAVVRFAVEWSQFDTACDLLKDCKTWPWNHDPSQLSLFKPLADDPSGAPPSSKSLEWHIPNIKRALRDAPPVRAVSGLYFDWAVRVDHGAEGKIRIVYEAATEVDPSPSTHVCLRRFPAAMFAWQVIFRGNNVFHERPVFICFPQGVSLHWSTTLPIATAELLEDDELTVLVTMIENPLVSMILYHFSADLGNTMATEDILNRLPHIEYRCLSSYSLYQQARAQQGGKPGQIRA